MTYEEWVEQGRPHWQCVDCKSIFVTIPIADGFLCPICKEKARDGER